MNRKKLVVTILCLCLVLASSSFALATDRAADLEQENQETLFLDSLNAIRGVEKDTELQPLDASNLTVKGKTVNGEMTEIVLPSDGNEVVLTKDNESFSVIMPLKQIGVSVQDNTALYIDGDGKVDHALRLLDKQHVELIKMHSADDMQKEFVYELQVPQGGRLEYYPNPDGTVDAILVINSDDEVVGGFAKGTSLDSDGNEVETKLTVKDNTVVQSVVMDDDTSYPVMTTLTAAAVDFTTYFWDGYFYYRSDGLTLGLWPNRNVIFVGSCELTWQLVVNRFKNQGSYWTNEASLRSQYQCHYMGCQVQWEGEWNLEPWRPNSSNPLTWLINKCNW